MKKIRIASCLLALLFLFSFLTGCHGTRFEGNASSGENETAKKQSFAVPETLDLSKQHEITFWAKSDTNVTQTRIYEKAIEDFEALYPNIKVKLKIYTDYGRIYSDVITNIPTKTTPNVCITYPDHIATYMKGEDAVVSLDLLFEDEKYGLGGSELLFDSPRKDEIIPKFLEECKINGGYYAIPYMRSTEACYVNKTYVEKLGFELPEVLTWDFVFAVSEAAMEKDENGNFKVNGQKVMIPFIYKSTDNMMIQMLAQKDAGYSTEKAEVQIFNDTTTSLLSMIAEHAATSAFSTFKISSYPANYLNRGQCIFAVDSTAGATWMGTDAPLSDIGEDTLVEFETDVKLIPQFDTEHPEMISQGPSVCIFNKADPQEVLASWLFAQYLLTNDVQIAYSQTEGYVPVTAKAQESEIYQDYLSRSGEDHDLYYDVKLHATRLLLENTENTFVTPVFDGSTSLRNAAGQMIENVVKSVRRKETIDEAYYEKLFSDMTSRYHLDEIQVIQEDGSAAPLKKTFGELPMMSKVLIGSLVCIWVLIAVYVITDVIKRQKNRAVS